MIKIPNRAHNWYNRLSGGIILFCKRIAEMQSVGFGTSMSEILCLTGKDSCLLRKHDWGLIDLIRIDWSLLPWGLDHTSGIHPVGFPCAERSLVMQFVHITVKSTLNQCCYFWVWPEHKRAKQGACKHSDNIQLSVSHRQVVQRNKRM